MTSQRHKLPGEHIYDGMVMHELYRPEVLDRVKTFPFNQDILIASYPKTGTTWVQELAWLIYHNGDFEVATRVPMYERIKYLEISKRGHSPYLDTIIKDTPPRIVKSHLPLRYFKQAMMEKSVHVIVPLRNPKDALVSLYHFYQMSDAFGTFREPWDVFFELYREKKLFYGDIFDWYEECWAYRDHPALLLLKYEDMKLDLKATALKIASFLNRSLSNDSVEQIVSHCQFDSMKENSMVNYKEWPHFDQKISSFIRKGTVGDWKNYFSGEQSDYIDEQYKKRLEPLGLTFQWE